MPSAFNKRDPWGSRRIAQIVTANSQGTIVFPYIAPRWTDLRLVFQGRTTTAGTSDSNVELQINGDATSGNYDGGLQLIGSGSAASSGALAPSSNGCAIGSIPNDGATANASGTIRIFIPNYAVVTAWFKTAESEFYERVGTTPTKFIGRQGFTWKSLAAIFSLKLTAAFKDGSIATLYGDG